MQIKIGGRKYHTTERFKVVCLIAAATTSFISNSIVSNRAAATPVIKEVERSTYESKNYTLANFDKFRVKKIEKQEPVKKEEVKFKIMSEDKLKKLDLRQPSGLNIEQAEAVVKGTKLEGLGNKFVEAENKYKVNALYLISHAALESGWGTNKLARLKNNLFGFQAYDDSPVTSASNFSSKGECILYVAEYISKYYLSENGTHYNGVTLKGMNVKYASDTKWADKIVDVMESAQEKMVDAQVI